MEQHILRKVQMTQLEIAKEIRRVCDENNIRYFLAGGTFLGAVRHKGFIPWDDDMDLGMLRKDYEEFCRIAPEKLKPEYCLQTWYTDPNYSLPFGKVVKRNTVYLEGKKTNRLKENGFYVDIFPVDYVPEEPESRAELAAKLVKLYRTKLMKSGYCPWVDNGAFLWKKRIGYVYYQLLSLFARQEDLARDFDALSTSAPAGTHVVEQEALSGPKYLKASLFDQFSEYPFEGEMFTGVADYDLYLSTLYGDYMQLPPEDQRENRHQIVEIDFGAE